MSETPRAAQTVLTGRTWDSVKLMYNETKGESLGTVFDTMFQGEHAYGHLYHKSEVPLVYNFVCSPQSDSRPERLFRVAIDESLGFADLRVTMISSGMLEKLIGDEDWEKFQIEYGMDVPNADDMRDFDEFIGESFIGGQIVGGR